MPAEPQHSSGSAISAQLQPGDAAQQLARLGADALGVGEVAGVVVGDRHRQRVPLARPGPSSARISATSRHLAGEGRAPACAYAGSSASSSAYSFIDDPQPAALTTTQSTPASAKASMSARAKRLRLRLPPVVHRQRPAAALRCRDDDVAALGRQHPRGGGVDPGEERALHAAGEHADVTRVGPAGRRSARAAPAAPAERRSEASIAASVRREPLQHARCARTSRQPGAAGRRAADRAAAAAAAGREEREDRAAQRPVAPRAGAAALHLGPGRLDQLVVLHARRAGGHAGHAAQAGVEVLDHRRRSAARPPAPRSSGRSGRAGSPSPRPTATYVGQVGRQKPQCTQSATSSASGGRCSSKAGSPRRCPGATAAGRRAERARR